MASEQDCPSTDIEEYVGAIKLKEENSKITDQEIMDLANKLGHEWTQIGVTLGYFHGILDMLEAIYPKEPTRRNFQMIKNWCQKISENGFNARKLLAMYFAKANRTDIADSIDVGYTDTIEPDKITELVQTITFDRLDRRSSGSVVIQQLNVYMHGSHQHTLESGNIIGLPLQFTTHAPPQAWAKTNSLKEKALQANIFQQCSDDSLVLEFPDNIINLNLGDPVVEIGDLGSDMQDDESTRHTKQCHPPVLPVESLEDHRFWEIPHLHFVGSPIEKPYSGEVTDTDGVSGDNAYAVLDNVYQYHPSTDVDDFVKQKKYSTLKRECEDLYFNKYIMLPRSSYIRFVDFYDNKDNASIRSCVTVREDFSADIVVHNCKLPADHFIWKNLPLTFHSVQNVQQLMEEVSSYTVCLGNTDLSFQENIPPNYYQEKPNDNFAGYREPNKGACFDRFSYNSTIDPTNAPNRRLGSDVNAAKHISI